MATVPTTTERGPADETTEELQERLAQLKRVGVGGHHARRLDLLREKLRERQSVLAFCGHFSAGKSTLINRLAGSQVLPASPIPTSANQVLLRHGEPGATVRLRDRGELQLLPSDLNRLADLCVDGDQVEAVEIRHPLAHVPQGLWLMDTPGIDSTDDAHRVVTESALYLADAVFYVMDYNHVQSDVNLQFTRDLTHWGKPLYLVVNQVDKHVEMELSFAQFRESVIHAFAAWGVEPHGLFFTSLREPENPLNEWDALVETIRTLGGKREELLTFGVWNSAVHVMEEEERLRNEALAPERERLLLEVEAAKSDPHLRRAVVAAELERLSRAPKEAVQNLNREVGAILANAPLFPFATKTLVERYLEARKPEFRVGFFFSAQKTAAEVESRLGALHVDLSEKVSAHIHWHLQDLLLRFAEQHAGRDESFEARVRALSVPLEPSMLAGLVNSQALVGREYLLQYMKEVAAEIQLRYRRALQPLADEAAALVNARIQGELDPLRAEEAMLARAITAAHRLAEMDEKARAFTGVWVEALGRSPAAASDVGVKVPVLAPMAGAEAGYAVSSSQGMVHGVARDLADVPPTRKAALRQADADRLRDAARLLASVEGMLRNASDLEQRAERLEESRFTVALFGAFSAGKSSFANALMGLHLLPVSPNPTTAVITRIEPPTAERPHGYVHVVWKSPEQLRREVERALEALDLPANGELAADLALGAGQARQATSPAAKPHAAFLTAAAQGYAAVREILGKEESADLGEFSSLVADERRSCFVKEISVYVDCPVTRQGITLVDTPGADSINARHTDVAFDYIKNADAILFVTYYNHAFSRADREFLTQLGRVKDAFALDKMFFVINAADLARDESELELVIGHVRRNLQSCGIQNARIFPLSSQTALWSRLHGVGVLPKDLAAKLERRLAMPPGSTDLASCGLDASGMVRFEADFYRFVVTDLSQMAVDSAMAELRRSVQTISGWLDACRADDGARAERLHALQTAEVRSAAAIAALDATAEKVAVERQIDELLYYVRRRVLVERFREGFVEAFNPAVLRHDSPDLKRALRLALNEVVQSIAFDLSQEMRATALRVENTVNRQAERFAERAAIAVSQHLSGWSAPAYSPIHLPVPTFSNGHEHLSPEPFQKLLGIFRSPEQFFAGGGRNQLCDELAKALEEPVAGYLASAREVLAGWYGNALDQRVADLSAEAGASAGDHVRGLTAVLAGTSQSGNLESVLDRLHLCLGEAG